MVKLKPFNDVSILFKIKKAIFLVLKHNNFMHPLGHIFVLHHFQNMFGQE